MSNMLQVVATNAEGISYRYRPIRLGKILASKNEVLRSVDDLRDLLKRQCTVSKTHKMVLTEPSPGLFRVRRDGRLFFTYSVI